MIMTIAWLGASTEPTPLPAFCLVGSPSLTAGLPSSLTFMQDGTNRFLAAFGPAEYHSATEYQKAVGSPLFMSSIGSEKYFHTFGNVHIDQRVLDKDPEADRMYRLPKKAMPNSPVITVSGPNSAAITASTVETLARRFDTLARYASKMPVTRS